MFYLVKTPQLLRSMYPSLVWKMPAKEKTLYLSFDDGPHPTATPFVLEQLKKFDAKASFFCIGKNVAEHPDIYRNIIDAGHVIGNHTFDHLNGWKTDNDVYLASVHKAAKYIDSRLFRPPYGKISKFQTSLLQRGERPFKIIMWSVLSGDFDVSISPDRCLQNVLFNAKAGSIIVFHDSTKAWDRMSFALPRILQHFSEKGYQFKGLNF